MRYAWWKGNRNAYHLSEMIIFGWSKFILADIFTWALFQRHFMRSWSKRFFCILFSLFRLMSAYFVKLWLYDRQRIKYTLHYCINKTHSHRKIWRTRCFLFDRLRFCFYSIFLFYFVFFFIYLFFEQRGRVQKFTICLLNRI